MSNNNLNLHQLPSPTTDDLLLNKLENPSLRRLDDQRTAMPWMVAEGVASIGWKIPNRPPKTHFNQDPVTDRTIDRSEQEAEDGNLTKQSTPSGLSDLLLAYRHSTEQSELTANRPTIKNHFPIRNDLITKRSGQDRFDLHKVRSTIKKTCFSNSLDQSGHFFGHDSTEIFDEKSALISRPSYSKLLPQLKFRLHSPSMPCVNSQKVQSRQVRVAED